MIPFAQLPLTFHGPTYEPERDQARLAHQIVKVFECMKDGKWRTLAEIAKATGAPEASVSSRLRDLRKDRFGGHTVDRQHLHEGLHQYRLVVKGNVHA